MEHEYRLYLDIARRVARARLYNMTSEDVALLVIYAGAHLGLSPIAALDMIYVERGRLSLSPRGALALLHRSPLIKRVEVRRLTDADGRFMGYECEIERSNGAVYRRACTLDDARRAGLLGSPNYQAYPENMCYWRAIGWAADLAAPDVLAGLGGSLRMAGVDTEVAEEIPPPVEDETVARLIAAHGEERVVALLTKHEGDIETVQQVLDDGSEAAYE